MGDIRSHYRTGGGDRKLEIVNGKAFSANQIYMPRPNSPDPPPIPPRSSRGSKTSSCSSSKSWSFNDPEMQRRKRIAKYKVYTVEGKVKSSFRRGFCWLKNKCSEIVHGF